MLPLVLSAVRLEFDNCADRLGVASMDEVTAHPKPLGAPRPMVSFAAIAGPTFVVVVLANVTDNAPVVVAVNE